MALATQPTLFDHTQLSTYRYWYEQLPYTAYDGGLSTGATPLVAIQDLTADTQGKQLALLGGIATTPVSNVSLQAQADALNRNWPTVGWPSGLAPIGTRPDDGLRATQQLLLTANNTSGAALTSPFQLSFTGALKQLTTADRILRGLSLSAQDRALAAKFQLGLDGMKPLTIRESLEQAFGRAVLSEDWQTYTLTATSTASPLPALTVDAVGREALVLTSIAASIPTASVGNLVSFTLGRDTQTQHLTVLLDNAAGLDTPWPVWCTALQRFTLSVTAATTTDNVVLRLGWSRVRLTTVLQALFGLLDVASLDRASQDLVEKLQAGVVA
jgi:hypothetical protein